MKTVMIGSIDQDAGKTSMIIGMAKVLGKDFGYLKPFGDRLFYRKKRLWDYDSALMKNVFDLAEDPEDISIGFDHAKLRYMYDEKTIKDRLAELAATVGGGKELLFIEGPKDLRHGSSVHLDILSVARFMDGNLVLVISGNDDALLDSISFTKRFLDLENIELSGVIVNKVGDVDDFRATYLDAIHEMGIRVHGIVPHRKELSHMPLHYLADRLFAKVIAGDEGLAGTAKTIFVGAMSSNAAMRNPLFKTEDKIIITSGDRSDMILAALETHTAAVIITNNILPPANIISLAEEKGIPLLLVPFDTYETARQIDGIQPLLTQHDTAKLELVTELVRKHVDVEALLPP